MSDALAFMEKLKRLRDEYAEQLPNKLKSLLTAWEQLQQAEWGEEGIKTLYRMVHSLSGSGKTFGFSALGEAARTLENHLKPLVDAKQVLSREQREQVAHLLAALIDSGSLNDQAGDRGFVTVAPEETAHPPRRIYIVEDDYEQAAELKTQLSYFGYEVSTFHTLAEFREAMRDEPDVVVLMDINFPEDAMGGIRIMHELQQGRAVPIPVFFLSAENGINYRLKAVRARGMAYLAKPVNMGQLIDKLDELTSTQSAMSYRVLIVDDQVALTNYYSAVLEQAGMTVCVVNDPMDVLKPLVDFSPDLILIDIYMPECNGMELATIIRQIDAFVGIPIVFLSSETSLDKQLIAVDTGGDDFLLKPIEPQHLVSSVTSRIRRSLLLRSFMVRDGLTGLLNHTAIKDQLGREMARSRRQGKPLAFAMIDIDLFKKVNDTYGHPVGDRVIKSLSRLLKQRLRENDIIGRYGGEEFAVVLVDSDGPMAMKVLDTIREDFSQLRHLAGNQEFSVTISCGIADNLDILDVSRMADAADKALYKAKHAGRNRIILSDDKSF